ncbi:LysR family transcriptional regulator [Pantoea latae]|uniref:LysR family transcriptional regulator n=1 Tax=Pantoea latae TaxID=1964541 RepID=A0A1V9DHW0_9GAMM|nr:LysR family transcriptional regulator [Pantoea latae]OQP33375.1 LysR family transcriptional regulator [Pantoea latae]
MSRENLNDLVAFVTVAREQSFTRAAALLGVSQSALSHSLRGLEARLGVRLLTRTTRSVSPTEAGQRLMASLAPRLDEIWSELAAISDMRDQPAGVVRITATDFAIRFLLWPKLRDLLKTYPDIHLELANEYALTDIAANRYDAGVRLGEQITNGMISVRIGPDIRFAVVGSPAYFHTQGKPATPQDLVQHRCINLRLSTHGGLYAWEFEQDGREIKVRVEGQLTFNEIYQVVDAALDGFGLAYVPEEMVASHIEANRLVRVLTDYCPVWEGHHLYYPSRKQSSRALTMVVDALRHRQN